MRMTNKLIRIEDYETMYKYRILDAWISCCGSYWRDDVPVKYSASDTQSVYHAPHAKLADKLMIPRVYLCGSHMPATFSLDKTVNIPGFGKVRFKIYQSGASPTRGLLRTYMYCPVCNKHLPVGRWWQHMDVHVETHCGTCHDTMTVAKWRKHRRTCGLIDLSYKSNG